MPKSRRFVIVDDNTIREPRDRQEEKRPRKRKREAESDDEEKVKPRGFSFEIPLNVKKGLLQHDPVYFKDQPEAKCFIRVGDFLFKIHEELLDCSPFMVALLEEHLQEVHETSEENPMIFILPTIEEYRSFLWALYASAEELAESPTDHEHIERLYNIASMTRKYGIPKMSEWVMAKIQATASNTIFMEACSSASLARLLEVSVENKAEDIIKAIVKKWCTRLNNKSAPSVPAVQAADKYELDELRGVAYYVHVQDMFDWTTSHTEKGALQLRADPKLNNGQVMRLLSGYWSLVAMWERLRLKPLTLKKVEGCSKENHLRCSATWDRRWISAAGWKRILGINSADILGLLACLRDMLSNDDDLKGGMNNDCRLTGLNDLKDMRSKAEEGMADHFYGCV